MHNIIKALNYQTKRDNFLIYAILAGFGGIIMGLSLYLETKSFSTLNGGMAVASIGSNYGYSFAVAFVGMLLATRICGWDYADKTMNYEILSGHNRKDVYWSRIIVCLGWCMAINMIIAVLPVAVIAVINGWGSNMDIGGAALRYLLLLFPVFRSTCEIALMTFLTRSCYIGMVVAFIYNEITTMFGMFMSEFHVFDCTWQLSSTNINSLFTFNTIMGYVNGEDIEVYETALEPSFVAGTIIASLAVGVGCLLLGYHVFKKSDVN